MNDRYILYKHITPNGKMYVGITSQSVEKRWKNGSNYASQSYFYRAIKKYGWENIEHSIVREGLTEEEAKIAERKMIKHYNTRDRKIGYNISPGGDVSPMKSLSSRIKSSESHKGRSLSESTKKKLSEIMSNRVLSDEHKSKIAESVKSSWTNESVRKKHVDGSFKRPVCMYSKDNKFLLRYESMTEAQNATGIDLRNIQACCKGRKKSSGGYIWKYEDQQANTEVNEGSKEPSSL